MSIAKYNLKAALRGLGVPVVRGNWVKKKDIASALLVIEAKGAIPKFTVLIEYDCETEDDWDSLQDAILKIRGVKSVKALEIDGEATASLTAIADAEETFKVYDHTKPASMKSTTVKCKESDLENCLRKSLSIPENYESKLSQSKKGSWVFKAGGKEYSVTKYMGE